MDKMLQFVQTEQSRPAVEAASQRTQHFNEIYTPFALEKAAEQASRCSQCGIPMCQTHCPVQNNIPDWLMLTASGRLQEAYAVSSATNSFPEICGRICPQDRLCEGNCVIEKDFNAVTIGAVEQYITETAFENGWVKPITPLQENGYSVGIIGAGPAGLAAAQRLRALGYHVHIYDRYDRVGGLLIYGIPSFKLEKSVVARRETLMRASGIEFTLNCTVGSDISFEQLRKKHDAVLIATGVYKGRGLDFEHQHYANFHPALNYLIASNRTSLGDDVPEFITGKLNAAGKKVVVIGGGDTAMDCVRTAIRQGAASVTCLYRRDRANMPGSAREVKHAEDEGVVFRWLSAPVGFEGEGSISAVRAVEMALQSTDNHRADNRGRAQVQPVAGSEFFVDADMVIGALGFEPEDLPTYFNTPELALTRWGTVKVNAQLHTNLDGVFAAGDIARGASLVVWAIRDGQDAAAAMHEYIEQKYAGVGRVA